MKAALSFQKKSSRIAGLSLLALLLCFLMPTGLRAQETAVIGTGTSTNYYPMPGFWGWQYDVYLYTPSAADFLNDDCTISRIAWNISSNSSTSGAQMTIWVKDVDASYSLSTSTTFATYTSGAQQVFNTTSLSTTTGWNTYNFSSGFNHTGGKALLVAVRGVGCTTGGGCSRNCYYTSASSTHWYKRQDSSDPGTSATGSVDGNRSNIQVTYTPAAVPCPKPKNLAASNISGTGATLSWTAGGSESNWTLQYATNSSFSNATSVTVTGTPTKNLTGLTSETTYYARVRANCGGSDGSSDWSGTCVFTPSNCHVAGTGTTSGYYVPVVTNYKNSYTQMLYTPDEVGGTGTILSVHFNAVSANSVARNIHIYMGTTTKTAFTSGTDHVSFNGLTEVYSGTWNIAAGWNTFTLSQPFEYDGTQNLVVAMYSTATNYSSTAFYSTTTSGYTTTYSYSDSYDPNPSTYEGTWSSYSGSKSYSQTRPNAKFCLEPASACETPSSITVSNVQPHSASVSWTEGSGTYNVEYKTASATTWTRWLSNTTSHSTSLTGLTPETSYQVRVQSVCGSETSNWKTSSSFTTGIACFPPTGLTVVSATTSSVTLSWNASGHGESAWQVQYRPSGGSWTTVNATSSPRTVTGLASDTQYEFRLRSNCGGNDGYSSYTSSVSALTGYCQPAPTSVDGSGITNVTFGMGSNVVNNSNRPTSSPYYGNYSSQIGAVEAGTPATVSITYQTAYTYGTIIWVDLNNNLSFDGNEVVYVGVAPSTSPTTLNATFTIPVGTTPGDYRMRIAGADSYYDSYTGSISAAASANPCPTGTYTIVHDYTLRVLAPACPTPTNLTASNVTAHTADLSWSGSANSYSGTYMPYENVFSANFDSGSMPSGFTNLNTSYPWTVTSSQHHSGGNCMVCGNSGSASSSSTVTYTATLSGAGFVSFYSRVSSESNWDYGRFYIDDVLMCEESGSTGWTQHTYSVSAGSHTFKWLYYKDSSGDTDEDSYYIDDIAIQCASTPVPFTSNTSSTTLTGLAANSMYTVQIWGVCGSDVSNGVATTTFTTQVSCLPPTNLAASNVAARSADISWSGDADSYEVMYGNMEVPVYNTISFDFENGVVGSFNSFTITNNSGYPWYVTSSGQSGYNGTYCIRSGNAGVSSSTSTFSITVNFPEAGSISFRGGCWGEGTSFDVCTFDIDGTQRFSNGAIQSWSQYTYNVTAGTHTFTWSYTKDSSVDPTGDGFFVDDIVFNGVFYGEPAYVELGSETAQSSPYHFTGLTPQTTYLVYVRANCGDDQSTWAGPTTFTTPEACATPTSITSSNVQARTATVSWTGGSGTYRVEYRASGETSWTTATNSTTATSFNFTGLNSATNYEVRVQSVCNDEESNWVTTTFRTPCENTLIMADGLTQEIQCGSGYCFYDSGGESGQYSNSQDYTAVFTSEGDITLAFSSFSTESGWDYISVYDGGTAGTALLSSYGGSTVPAAVTATSGTMTVVWHSDGSGLYDGWSATLTAANCSSCPRPTNLAVSNVDMNSATLTWTPAQGTEDVLWAYSLDGGTSWLGISPNDVQASGSNLTANISGLHAGQSYRVCVRAICNADVSSRPSNIVSITAEACPVPTNLTVSDIASRTATVTWNAGNATSWNIWVTPTGGTQDALPLTPVQDNTYALTGLEPETEYTVKVRTDCGNDDYSDWTVTTFTTLVACPAPTDVVVDNILPTSATVTWNGTYSDLLRYGQIGQTSLLQYDNDVNATNIGGSSVSTMTWGVMYPADQITGTYLTKVAIYENVTYLPSSITVSIYNGGDNAPGTLLYTQPATPIGATGWNEIPLMSPVSIDPNQNLWIVLTATGTYVMPACSANTPNNTWWALNGYWAHMGDDNSNLSGYGWMIRGYVADNIAWSDLVPATSPYDLSGLSDEADYAVQVQTYCGGLDGSSAWAGYQFTTPSNCGAPEALDVTDIAFETANLSWTGYQNSYEVRYGQHILDRLQYDNGVNNTNIGSSTSSTRTWGVLYTADQITGRYLTKVAIYENAAYEKTGVTLSVYAGGDAAPGTLLHSQEVTPSSSSGWNEIVFASPVSVDPNQNLWIVFSATGTYVMAACTENTPNNTWWYTDGTWSLMGNDNSSLANYGWMIRGYVEDPVESDVAWTTISNVTSPLVLEGLDEYTSYGIQVRGIYENCQPNGLTPWSEPFQFTTLEKCPHPTDLIVDRVGFTTAKLSWTNHGDASEWIVYYGTSEDPSNGTQVTVTGEPTTTLTCLEPGTYYAYVMADCGNDGLSAAHSNIVSFNIANRPSGTVSDNLTVYDGTTTNSYVPVYGFYADAYLKSEFVIPAADLSSINGATLSSMTFYASQTSVSWGSANFQVFLKEVTSPTVSSFSGPGTVVYTGSLSISNGTMTVNFSTPYEYHGGNLLVGIYNTVEGSYVSSSWYGTTVSGASVQNYSYSDLSSISATQRDFIPKTTFAYTITVDMDAELAGEIETGTATVCQSESYTIQSVNEGEAVNYRWKYGNTLVDGETGATCTIMPGMLEPGTYTFTREAKDECVDEERYVASAGSFTLTVTPAPEYADENAVTAEPVYCGFDGVWAAPHSDSYQHFWYTDAACTQLYATGDTVTMPMMTETVTLWHKVQSVDMVVSQRQERVYVLQENCDDGDASGWSTSGDGYEWTIDEGGYNGGIDEAHSGDYNFTVDADGLTDDDDNALWSDLLSPVFDLTNIPQVTVSFWYANPSWAGDVNRFQAQYSRDGGSWTNLLNTIAAHGDWTQGTYTIQGNVPNCRLRFRQRDFYGYSVCLDDIEVYYTNTVNDTTYVSTGCPSMPVAYELVVNPHPEPQVAIEGETYCGLPVTLSVENAVDGFLYQWSSNADFTDNLSSETDYSVTLPAGNYTYYVRSYREVAGDLSHEAHSLLEEGFESGYIPQGWYSTGTQSAAYWTARDGDYVTNAYAHTGSYYACSRTYWNSEDHVTDEWLVTPAIDLRDQSVIGEATLSWWISGLEEEYPQNTYGVYVLTQQNNVSSATLIYPHETMQDATWYQRTVDLSDYIGSMIYIGFRHQTTSATIADASGIMLDDISVTYRGQSTTIGCTAPHEVNLEILPAPAPHITGGSDTVTIVCGDNVTLTVNEPIEGYEYDWSGSQNFTVYTTTEEFTPADPIWNAPTSYYVRSRVPGSESDQCMSENTKVTILLMPVTAPVVSDVTVTCGTPAILNITGMPEEMANFQYEWTEGHSTQHEVGNSLRLTGFSNIDERTFYVQAFRLDNNGNHVCESAYDTVHISITPISDLTASIYDEEGEYTDHVCEGSYIELWGENITNYYDNVAVPAQNPIPTYAVWYRRPVGSTEDSLLYRTVMNYGTGDPGFDTVASETGAWQYYAYAATHPVSSVGDNSITTLFGGSTFTPSGNSEAGSISFAVSAEVPILIDTLYLFPLQDGTTNVTVYYKEEGDANPTSGAWHNAGTYDIVKHGAVGQQMEFIALNSPILVPGHNTYSIFLYSGENLLYDINEITNLYHYSLPYTFSDDRSYASIITGYAMSGNPVASTTNNIVTPASELTKARFLGSIHYNYSSGNRMFGCMSVNASEAILTVDVPSTVQDTLMVRTANNGELLRKHDGVFTCAGNEVMLVTNGQLGDNAEYVWMSKPADSEDDFAELARTSANTYTTTVPDETTVYGVYISSEVCGETDMEEAMVYIAEVPEVADIQFGPLCAPYTIASDHQAPAVARDGEWIVSRSWQISEDGEEYQDWDPATEINTAHNGWKLRYRATTECEGIEGYSNVVTLVVDTAAYFETMDAPAAICSGHTFDWEGNAPNAVFVNNSQREVRYGFNFYVNGQFTEFNADYAFMAVDLAQYPNYYQYNRYVITACDSVVSDLYTITVWATPDITVTLPDRNPNELCAGLVIGNYFNFTDGHNYPDYEDHGSTDFHGWEIADMLGATSFTRLSNGVDTLDTDVILDYTMNGKILRYYIENQCGLTTSNVSQISITDHPYIGTLADMAAVCDGTPFAMDEPEITDDGNIFLNTTGWYLADATSMEIIDTVEIGETMTLAWDGKLLCFGATNTCGTGFSNFVKVTVNPLPEISVSVLANQVELASSTGCFGPDYMLSVAPANPDDEYTYEWSDELGSDNVADLGRLEAGEYTYTVTATAATGCQSVATASFTIENITSEKTVTICEDALPYTFDADMQAVYDEEGDYDIRYTTVSGCDSVVTLHLNVLHPQVLRTSIHLCNNDDMGYTWAVNGLTYGANAADTIITDTVIVTTRTEPVCDSIIYALRVYISNDIYINLPDGDEFSVAVGEPVHAQANVSGECLNSNFKTALAYQLFKDDQPVDMIEQYGEVNILSYLPQQNTYIGRDIAEGQGEIPSSTFTVQYYNYDYFYSKFFLAIKNNITATWNEPGDYRLQMVLIQKAYNSGQDFPMTYRDVQTNEITVIGGSGSVSTDVVFSDTVNILFHVEGEYVPETPGEPVPTYIGSIDIDTTVFDETVSAVSDFNVAVVGDASNAQTKLALDYVITHNGDTLGNVAPYGAVTFSTEVARYNRSFGGALANGIGSIPENTFNVLYYQFDYFYNHFFETVPSRLTVQWNQPGVYEVTFNLRQRVDGQDIPLTYSNDNSLLIGGHGSANGPVVATQKLVFNVAAETVTIDLDETICDSELPFVYNGHEFASSGSYTFSDASGVYDTVFNVNLTINTGTFNSFTDAACGSYEWNGTEYTATGDYTYEYTNDNGCLSVDTLHLTIVPEPVIRVSASTSICEGTNLPVSVQVIYQEGFDNETSVSFAQAPTSTTTSGGYVTLRYDATISNVTESMDITVASTNSSSINPNNTCVVTDTVSVTVIPGDTIAHFTDEICQGEAYVLNGFNIAADRTAEPGVILDTIITGTSACATYRAALELTVRPAYNDQNPVVVTDEVCEGYAYQGNGFVLTAEEIAAANTLNTNNITNQVVNTNTFVAVGNVVEFRHNDETAYGCDSVTVLQLTVNPTVTYEFNAEACVSYEWNNEVFTESDDIVRTFTAVNGCDSVVTLHLTINQPVSSEVTVTACERHEWNNEVFTESGDIVRTFTAANSCDSVVTLHLTVNNGTYNSFTETACDVFYWMEQRELTESGIYFYDYTNEAGCPSTDTLHLTINQSARTTVSATVTSSELPYEWNGVVFTAADTLTATLETANACDSVVTMILAVSDVTGSDPFMTVTTNGDTAILTAFANAADDTVKVSIDYHLYKKNAETSTYDLVENMEVECGGDLFIGTEFQNRLFGEYLSEPEGNVPGNTFHISNYHYDYFYWAFFDGRATTVTHHFTQTGEYKVVFELIAETGGQDFQLPYDNDYTHHIGGKNSTPTSDVLATAEVTFNVTAVADDDTPQTTSGPVLSISGPADGSVADTLTVSAPAEYDNEKVAIRYTIYSGDDEEPLPMLSSVGSVRIATNYNNNEFGDNLTASTGFIPEATFHPVSRYYNYFYMHFLESTYNTITASWTVPGTYRIVFELVQMTGGQDFPLTYGTEYKRLGGKTSSFANVIYDTKTLTYTAGNTSQNNAATGIADNNSGKEDLVLYPNPANDRAVLTVGDVSAEAFIVVTDVNGKEVLRAPVTGSSMEFSVATWSEGVYFVTLRDNTQIVTKKLVVTK